MYIRAGGLFRAAAVRISSSRLGLLSAPMSEAPLHRLREPLGAPTIQASHLPRVVVPGFAVTAPHSRVTAQAPAAGDYMLSHSVYTEEEVASLKTDVHFTPVDTSDRLAKLAVTIMRRSFDIINGYKPAPHSNSTSVYLTRGIFLETVAGVPGMVASMARHFESLRLMRRDGGWIHTLLSEAENERMHLLTWLAVKHDTSFLFRSAVLITQGIFFNIFFLTLTLQLWGAATLRCYTCAFAVTPVQPRAADPQPFTTCGCPATL